MELAENVSFASGDILLACYELLRQFMIKIATA